MLIFLTLLNTAWATDFEVGGTGMETLQEAATVVGPGDVILMHAGTYQSADLRPSGTADAPIRLQAFGDGDVILQGRMAVEGSYWELSGFILDAVGDSGDALRLRAHNLLLEDLEIRNGASDGIDGEGTNITIRRVTVHDFDAASIDAHCIVVQPGSLTWLIEDSTLYDCNGDGIYLFAPAALNDTLDITIRNNEIYWTGTTPRMENGIDVSNGDGVLIENNTLHGFAINNALVVQKSPTQVTVTCNTLRDSLSGAEFRSEDGGLLTSAVFAHNLLYNFDTFGLKFDEVADVHVANNTIADVDENGLQIDGLGITDGFVRNNLFVRAGSLQGGTFDADHNAYFEVPDIQIVSDSDIEGDPSVDAAWALLDDSPLIDAGVDVGWNFDGDAPDIGFFESGLGPCAQATLDTGLAEENDTPPPADDKGCGCRSTPALGGWWLGLLVLALRRR